MKFEVKKNLEIKYIQDPRSLSSSDKKDIISMMSELDHDQDKYDKYVKYYNSVNTNPEKKFEEAIINNSVIFILFNKQSDENIGFILMDINLVFKLAYLSLFYIKPEYQHKGLGSYFLTEVEEMLKNKFKINLMSTSALKNNRIANELYKRLGFNVTGINYMKEI